MGHVLDKEDIAAIKEEIRDHILNNWEDDMIIKTIEERFYLDRDAIRILINHVKTERHDNEENEKESSSD